MFELGGRFFSRKQKYLRGYKKYRKYKTIRR